jgi:hypothetical protein
LNLNFAFIIHECCLAKFIHTYVGWPGSIHDAGMFRNSDLNDILEPVPKDLHI